MKTERTIPELDEDLPCPVCSGETEVFMLHGMFGGGGEGHYTICGDCGTVISKSFDSHEKDDDDDLEERALKHAESIEQGTEIEDASASVQTTNRTPDRSK